MYFFGGQTVRHFHTVAYFSQYRGQIAAYQEADA